MKRFAYVRSCLTRTSWQACYQVWLIKRCVAGALAYNMCVHTHHTTHTHTHTTLACDISIATCLL